MAIPETQLETWSHQGAVTTAKATADSIRNALASYRELSDNFDFEVYLQGSYKNDTNIRGDSDVDVVAQLNSTFYSNLSEEQKRQLGLSKATYGWTEFKSEVLKDLIDYYGQNLISEGNKAIKIKADSGRLPADVIVCSQYRKYLTVNDNDYIDGMCFWSNGRQIINFPKVHYDNGVKKHQDSIRLYKPSVRMFKNMRASISSNGTPSYFLECMFYNVPNNNFGKSFQDIFCNSVNWLNGADLGQFTCQNGQIKLFGPSQEQWDITQAKNFINNLISLWNNWGK